MTELSQTIAAHLTATLTSIRRWLASGRRDERGNVTLETLLWALGIVAIAGIAVAALTAFINGKISLLR